MRNPARIKPFLSKLQKLWEQHPDLRFGQLVRNICNKKDIFNIEDFEFEEMIEQFTAIQVLTKHPFGFNIDAKSNTGCGCRKCNLDAWWMVVCDICGNKRCPHATNHELECTNSNESGQKGSVFE